MTPRLGGTAMGEFVAPLFSSRASSITFSSSKESTSSAQASLSARPYSIEETTRYLFPPAAPSTRRQITGSGARKPERWYTEASCWGAPITSSVCSALLSIPVLPSDEVVILLREFIPRCPPQAEDTPI